MLVSFSVANFRSFSEEQTFSLVASGRIAGTHDDHTISIPDSEQKVLKIGVVYGANGAGKSNLFKALEYLVTLATKPRKRAGTGRISFKFNDLRNEASRFDLHFISNNKLYRYGVVVDDQRIQEEWLIHVVGQREKIIFERVTSDEGSVAVDAPGLGQADKAELLAKIGGPENQTFLATVNATIKAAELGEHLANALEWLKDNLRLSHPNEPIAPVGHMLADGTSFRDFASEFLRNSSTGVYELEVEKEEITEQELERMVPKDIIPMVFKDLEENEGVMFVQPNGQEILVEKNDADKYYRLSVSATHRLDDSGDMYRLSLNDESDGTRRLLQLLPAIHLSLLHGSVYFIDEIDRSMHPLLIWKFLEAFLKSGIGKESQIIVTTHESNLLDLELLRRDEIWFAEKGHDLGTNLYSLSEYKVRKDLEIRKHYLQGRFGAVPFLGAIDNLFKDS